MGDRTAQIKSDEQYPLLKVDTGGGDNGAPPTLSSNAPAGWTVTCNKQSWYSRWPEFVSACWMTLILLGISFLVFYALGTGVLRRQPVIIVRCNSSVKPNSEVFYHYIQRANNIPFTLYSNYLSKMAQEYPSLRFNVIFLTPSRFLDKLFPRSRNGLFYATLNEYTRKEMKDFQFRHQNVNITVIPLSKYMASTPLRYRWKTIPQIYLTFYLRVLSVWVNGGVGLELETFNHQFNNHQPMNKISSILKQLNDGEKPEEPTVLNTMDADTYQDGDMFAAFYGLIDQILNDTWSFINKDSSAKNPGTSLLSNETLVRKQRAKREIPEQVTIDENLTETSENTETTTGMPTTTMIMTQSEMQRSADKVEFAMPIVNYEPRKKINESRNSFLKVLTQPMFSFESKNKSGTSNETSQVVIFYDFMVFSDNLGPSYAISQNIQPNHINMTKQSVSSSYKRSKSSQLWIDPDGTFIAASAHYHPFLGHLITAGCQRMHPKFAIQDAFLTQCSGIFRDDVYCNNIAVIT